MSFLTLAFSCFHGQVWSANAAENEESVKKEVNFDVDGVDIERLDLQKNSRVSVQEAYGSKTGYLAAGGNARSYVVSIDPGIMLRANLVQPKINVDYDLYIFDSTGSVILDASANTTYTSENQDKTCEESVGIINTANIAQDYILYVHSSYGGSTSANDYYTLTYSINYPYDAWESDENPMTANTIAFDGTAQNITSRTISSRIDCDWYQLNIPEAHEYYAIDYSVSSTDANSYKVDVFYDLDGQYTMRKVKKDGSARAAVMPGTYYIRVSHAGGVTGYNPDDVNNYSLSLLPVYSPDNIEITKYECDDKDAGIVSGYIMGAHYRAVGSITVKGRAMATNKVTGVREPARNENITVQLINTAYNEFEKPQFYERKSENLYTDANGYFSCKLSFAPCTESFQYYASRSTHYYDCILVKATADNGTSVVDTDYVYQMGRVQLD